MDAVQKEVFSEIVLFGPQDEEEGGFVTTADCGCFACDGNPCVKVID